jgi:hypothetical protein
MTELAQHAVFVLPTREDVAIFETGGKPGNVLWREFDTHQELACYICGIEHIEDEFDEIDHLERKGKTVIVGRSEGRDRHDFETEADAEAFMQGVNDADGFHAPKLIDREDEGFARLADLGHAPSAGPRP